MKYRIVEFKKPIKETGERFFIDSGKVIWTRRFLFVYLPKTIWERVVDKENIPLGFRDIEAAVGELEELKDSEPIYHEVK